jgi:hypothetical protein
MKTFIAISTAVALAAAGIYQLRLVHNAVCLVDTRNILSSPRIPNSLEVSAAAKIVNPHDHIPIHDTRSLNLRVRKNLSDEEILSRFVKGFFGGTVFAPERSLLRVTRKEITRFDGE